MCVIRPPGRDPTRTQNCDYILSPQSEGPREGSSTPFVSTLASTDPQCSLGVVGGERYPHVVESPYVLIVDHRRIDPKEVPFFYKGSSTFSNKKKLQVLNPYGRIMLPT